MSVPEQRRKNWPCTSHQLRALQTIPVPLLQLHHREGPDFSWMLCSLEKSSDWRWLPRAGTGNRTQTTAQYFDNSPISPNYQPCKSQAAILRNHHTPPLAPPHYYFVLVYNTNIFQLNVALKTLTHVCCDTAVRLESLLLITSENANSLQIWRSSVTCYRQTLTSKTCSAGFRNLWHQNRSLSGSLAPSRHQIACANSKMRVYSLKNLKKGCTQKPTCLINCSALSCKKIPPLHIYNQAEHFNLFYPLSTSMSITSFTGLRRKQNKSTEKNHHQNMGHSSCLHKLLSASHFTSSKDPVLGLVRIRGKRNSLPLWGWAVKATGANSSKRSAAGLESREQSSRESSPVRESESRLASQGSQVEQDTDSVKFMLAHSYSHPFSVQHAEAKQAQTIFCNGKHFL